MISKIKLKDEFSHFFGFALVGIYVYITPRVLIFFTGDCSHCDVSVKSDLNPSGVSIKYILYVVFSQVTSESRRL